jgi:hypothetical protein
MFFNFSSDTDRSKSRGKESNNPRWKAYYIMDTAGLRKKIGLVHSNKFIYPGICVFVFLQLRTTEVLLWRYLRE